MDFMRPVRTRGRPKAEVGATLVRDIEDADIEALALSRPTVTPIKALRDSHHTIARLVAQGMRYAEICSATGYTISRISVLASDPAFKELVAHYRESTAEVRKRLDERLVDATGTALSILQERMEDEPEAFENEELLSAIKTLADRAGYGPQKTQNVNVSVGMADRIKAARQRIIDMGNVEVIQDG